MAIPAIVLVISLYLLRATIRVKPPAIAISTSLTSGFVLVALSRYKEMTNTIAGIAIATA